MATTSVDHLAVDYETGISNAWSTIATFVPKLILFLVILIVAIIVARVLAKIVDKVLERVGFDNAVERGGIKQALSRSQYDASDIVSKIVYYAVLLIGLTLAFNAFGPNAISAYLSSIVAYLPKIFVAIIIIVIASAAAAAVKSLISNTLGGLGFGNILANGAAGLILFFGVIAALNQLQIAQYVTNSVLTAVLAIVVGVTVVGVGGGLIKPMQQRWETMLNSAEQQAPQIKQQVQQSRQSSSPYPAESYSGATYAGSGSQPYTSATGSTQYDLTDQTTSYTERNR